MRWFGHVQQRPMTAPVRKGETMQLEGTERTRGRPKLTSLSIGKFAVYFNYILVYRHESHDKEGAQGACQTDDVSTVSIGALC